ncbi:MAG: hypothetical protein EG823_03055 [Actinobacteria bacterium]|nr:hypothetical protein [Actinomycetota bacterium]
MASKTTWSRSRTLRFAATTILVAVTVTLVAGLVPNAVTAQAATDAPVFRSKLSATAAAGTLAASTTTLTFTPRALTETYIAPVTTQRSTTRTVSTGSAGSTGSTAAAAPVAAVDETAQAQSILAGLIAQYPILAGSTVSFGDAKGSQAIAYYQSGRIVISPTHTASLSRILNHEIWHIIDWRDNGVIDWGESVPPK